MKNQRQYVTSLTWILVVFLVFGLFRLVKEVRTVISYMKEREVIQQSELGTLLATTTTDIQESVVIEATTTLPVLPDNFVQYQNTGYGFSLYYPKLWTIKDSSYTYEGEPKAFIVLASPPVIVSDDKGITRVYFELCLDLSSRETVVDITCRGFKRYTRGDTGETPLPKNAYADREEVLEAKNILESIRTLEAFRNQEDIVLFEKPKWSITVEKPQGWTVLHDVEDVFEMYHKVTNDKVSISLSQKDMLVTDVTLKELLPFSKESGRIFKDTSKQGVYFLMINTKRWFQLTISKEELLQMVVLEVMKYK